MNKTLKIVLIVLAIFAALAIAAFFWGKSVWDKISFGKPRLVGFDLQGLTLADLANVAFAGSEKEVTVTLEMDVKNDNNFSIPFSMLKVKLFYNDQEIAETSNMMLQKQSVPANGIFTATDNVKLILNNSTAQMLMKKIKKETLTLTYKVMVKIFGIPLPKAFQTYTLDI